MEDRQFITDGTTFINGFGLMLALAMGLLMLALPRRQALLPVVVLVCFMTMGQRVMLLGLNFTMIRLLLLFGLVRVVVRGETAIGPRNAVDRMMIAWVVSSIVTYTLLWKTTDAFVNRLGMAYDALGLYFLLRMLVRDLADMRTVIRQFALMVMPLALCMLIDKATAHNVFSALGGVPPYTATREGVLRCQGPFGHPILAGAFGSALIPLFLGLYCQGGVDRLLALLGLACSAVICWAAGSSGPLMAAGVGLVGWAIFGLRAHMQAVRRLLAFGTLGLHLCMAAPVWFLLARLSVFDGSTGFHRAILIDHAVHHFPEWALIGIYSTASWGYYMFDVTNQYVLVGVQGGIVTLVLFVLVIARSFASAGIAVRTWGETHRRAQKLGWGLGCSLVVHAMNYISVPYFDQNIVCWYLLLAMLATARDLPRAALAPQDQAAKAPAAGRAPAPLQMPVTVSRAGPERAEAQASGAASSPLPAPVLPHPRARVPQVAGRRRAWRGPVTSEGGSS